MTRFRELMGGLGTRCALSAGIVWVLAGAGCNSRQCVEAPGVCPPSLTCVDGFWRTGSASCANGTWICEQVACVVDAGTCDATTGSSPDAREVVASIRVTASTNSGEIDVAVFNDGSAERTIGPDRYDASTGLDPPPKSYPPGSPEVTAFLCDLAAVGDVSAIPADPGGPYPTLPGCAKSVSFGTITTVTAGGKTSGDLQCLDNPTPAATALAHDAAILCGQ